MQSNEEKNCAQVVLGSFSEGLGLEKEKAEALAAPFGGGRYGGETCGCVTAATMVLGLAYDGTDLFEKVKPSTMPLPKKTAISSAKIF